MTVYHLAPVVTIVRQHEALVIYIYIYMYIYSYIIIFVFTIYIYIYISIPLGPRPHGLRRGWWTSNRITMGAIWNASLCIRGLLVWCILHRWQYLLDRGHTARDEGGGHGFGLDFFLGIWIAWVALGRFESLWIALSGVPSRRSDHHLSSQDVHAVATLVPTIRWG